MPDILLNNYGTLQVGGRVYRFGSRQPRRHTVTAANVKAETVVIPGGTPGSQVLLWSSLIDRPTSFKFLHVEVDASVELEFIADEDNSVGQKEFVEVVEPSVDFQLGSDESYANYTPGWATGTLDKIETIRARRKVAGNAVLKYLITD